MQSPSARYLAAALLLCLVGYHVAGLDGETVVFEDSAVYVVLAESLASGQGYTHISYAGDLPHVKYPPLLPALLAPLVSFFGRDFFLMKALVCAFACAALWCIYLVARRLAGEGKALLITAVVGLSPWFFSYSHEIISDIPFLALSLAALYLLHRYAGEDRWITAPGLGAATLIALTTLTRSVGLALLLAAPVALLLHKRARGHGHKLLAVALFTALCAAPAAGWMVRSALLTPASGPGDMSEKLGNKPLYLDFFFAKNEYDADEGSVTSPADLVPRIHHNLYAYGHGTAGLLFPALLPPGQNLLVVVVALPIFIGFCVRLWRERAAEEIYVVLYAVALLLYPTAIVPRYLVPILPFLLVYFLGGLEVLGRLVHRGVPRVGLATAAVALVATNLSAAVSAPPARALHLQAGLTEYRHVATWLRMHTPPDTVVMSRKPNMLYLWSDRKGVRFPFTTDAGRILDLICEKQVDSVVQDSFSPMTERFLGPAIARHVDLFGRVYSANETHLFTTNRGSWCGGDGAHRRAGDSLGLRGQLAPSRFPPA